MTHDCSRELKDVSLQVTPARIAAMQLFESHDKPVDAPHIIDHLQKELGIDRVTVFRILNAFVERGLINKIEFKEGKARYELTSRGDHHHFVCSVCGDIIDIGKDTLMHDYMQRIEKKYGYKITQHSLEFFGICKNCQK